MSSLTCALSAPLSQSSRTQSLSCSQSRSFASRSVNSLQSFWYCYYVLATSTLKKFFSCSNFRHRSYRSTRPRSGVRVLLVVTSRQKHPLKLSLMATCRRPYLEWAWSGPQTLIIFLFAQGSFCNSFVVLQMEASKPIKRGNFIIYKNKLLGQGSFASTYLATSASNPSELYACKTIDKKQADKKDKGQEKELFKKYFITRLQEEVKAWKELDHPNIVKFYDIVQSQNSIYMILEYCEGGNLENCLKSQLVLEPQIALQYAIELLSACTYLYNRGIIHRDIKPANILLKDGHLKISDFGLAKVLEKDELNTFKTGTVAGSPCYMAPEVLRQEKYGRSCDVWSVGVILYRMFLGVLPWQLTENHKSQMKVLTSIDQNQIKMTKKLPQTLEKLIRGMLEQDGRKRIAMPDALDMIRTIKF